MKVTVIGPWGGYPKAGEATSGYLFQQAGYNLLVECGSGVISHLQKYIRLERLNAVLFSHFHYDHCSDIGALQYAWLINTRLGNISAPLPIYGPNPSGDGCFIKLDMEPYTLGVTYSETDSFNLGSFHIRFCRTRHPALCYAMQIRADHQTVVYTADTGYFEGMARFARDADLLIAECSLYEDIIDPNAGHLNSAEAGKIADSARAKQLLLTHLPQYGDNREMLTGAGRHFTGRIELATPGWSWGEA